MRFILSYFDTRKGYRLGVYYEGTENTSKNQVMYYAKKKVGFKNYKYWRDIRIETENERQ